MYSQCGEDAFLNNNIFKNKKNGFYIELGALDGGLYSNTKYFEDKHQWKGVLIEPHPNMFVSLTHNRPNNMLVNNLVSCSNEPLNYKYFVHHHAAVSGIESTLPQGHYSTYFDKYDFLPQNNIMLHPVSLTAILKASTISHFDLLSLDVEGHEYEVLLSWDFSIPIDVILIETLDNETKNEQCRQLLMQHNYTFYSKCAHNEIYIRNGFLF
jgi:FkbM family methyltransferase